MGRRSNWRIWGLILGVLLGVPQCLTANEIQTGNRKVVFVKRGEAIGVYEPGTPWQRSGRFLEGTGKDALLLADHDLGANDFEIRIDMSIEELGGCGTELVIGHGKFGFDGENGNFYIEGLPFGSKLAECGPNRGVIKGDRPFRLRVLREGKRFRIFINGSLIAECSVPKRELGRLGILPKSGKVRIANFWGEGDLLDVDRRVRINPEELAQLEHNDRLDGAIEAALDYLTKNIGQRREAYLHHHHRHRAGAVALETYALIVAGIAIDDPVIVGNFSYLENEVLERNLTYDLTCAIFAHDAAISQLQQDLILLQSSYDERTLRRLGAEHYQAIDRFLEQLLANQNETGAWRYNHASVDYDHSCTQFAALALGVVARRGFHVSKSVWIGLAEHLLGQQQADGPLTKKRATIAARGRPPFHWSSAARAKERETDKRENPDSVSGGTSVTEKPEIDPFVGSESIEIRSRGWNYAVVATDSATWNMTCSGVSSLMLVYDQVGNQLSDELRKKTERSIRDGIGWLLENWNPHASHYAIYSLEKVGDIGGIELFDGVDWYQEASKFLLESQKLDGSWESNGTGEEPRISTALALLVLRRATTLLTRNPADLIIETGSGIVSRKEEENRSWVYVDRLNRSISFSGLIRTLRFRSSIPLLQLLQEVVEQYPKDYAPEMIPSLLIARARLSGKGPLLRLDRCLEEITEEPLPNPKAYEAWYLAWHEIRTLAAEPSEEAVEQLEKLYRDYSKDTRLKLAILSALIRCRAISSLPMLLQDLNHRDVDVRLLVYQAVKAFHIENPPPFNCRAKSQLRAKQISKILEWVEQQNSQATPD